MANNVAKTAFDCSIRACARARSRSASSVRAKNVAIGQPTRVAGAGITTNAPRSLLQAAVPSRRFDKIAA